MEEACLLPSAARSSANEEMSSFLFSFNFHHGLTNLCMTAPRVASLLMRCLPGGSRQMEMVFKASKHREEPREEGKAASGVSDGDLLHNSRHREPGRTKEKRHEIQFEVSARIPSQAIRPSCGSNSGQNFFTSLSSCLFLSKLTIPEQANTWEIAKSVILFAWRLP